MTDLGLTSFLRLGEGASPSSDIPIALDRVECYFVSFSKPDGSPNPTIYTSCLARVIAT